MSHNGNDNPGNYPLPPNEGYVVPSDHELPIDMGSGPGPANTIVGEEAVSLLTDFALVLIGNNSLFSPASTFTDKNPSLPGSGLDSLYNSIVKVSKFHQIGNTNLEKLRDFFSNTAIAVNSQVYVSLATVAAFQDNPLSRDDLDKLSGTTTEVAKDFIKEIVRLERDRNALGIENLDNLEVNKSQYNTFTSENKTFTDKNPNAPGQDSLYEAVIKDTPLHREGIIDLEHLRDTFARPGRVSSTSVTHTTLDAVNNTMLNRQISRNNLNAAQGTKATEAFVKEIVKNDAQRDTLGINEHPLLNNSDVTLNTKYLKSVKVGG